jgi:hypothetical protein
MSTKYPPDNICDYLGHVVRGLLLTILSTLLISGVLAFIYGNLVGWFIASIVLHTLHICLLVGFIIYKVVPNLPNLTFIKTAYRSWREKSCVPIKFKN